MFRSFGRFPTRLSMLALPVIVTLPPNTPEPTPGAPRPAHHTAQGYFENPWPSFSNWSMTPSVLVHMLRDWKSKPVRPSSSAVLARALDV